MRPDAFSTLIGAFCPALIFYIQQNNSAGHFTEALRSLGEFGKGLSRLPALQNWRVKPQRCWNFLFLRVTNYATTTPISGWPVD